MAKSNWEKAQAKMDALKVGEQFGTQGKLYQVSKISGDVIEVDCLDENEAPLFETDILYKELLLVDFQKDFEDDQVNLEVDFYGDHHERCDDLFYLPA